MNKTLLLLEKPCDTEIRMGFFRQSCLVRIGMGILFFGLFSTFRAFLSHFGAFVSVSIIFYSVGYFIYKIQEARDTKIIKSKRKGFIRLRNNELELSYKDDLLKIAKEDILEFQYFNYHGEMEYKTVHIGTTNYLKFKNDVADKFYIYLSNSKDVKVYNEMIMWCLENSFQVKEYNNGERVYGGKKLKYKELQAFKRKYEQS